MLNLAQVLRDIIVDGKNRPVVDLSNQKVTPEELKIIAKAAFDQGYNTYNLSGCGLTARHIDGLIGKGVETLRADNNSALGALGAERIAAVNPVHLELSYSQAGGRLSAFQNTRLETLIIRGGTATGVTMTDIVALMANPNFKEINLSGNALNFGNAGCLKVAANTRMVSINFRGCEAWDDTALLLSKNLNLRALDLSNCRTMTSTGWGYVGNIPGLTHFTAIGIPNSNVVQAAKISSLQVLNLSFSLRGDADLAAFTKLPNVTTITAQACGLTDASVDLLLSMPNLTYADVRYNAISSAKQAQLDEFIADNISRAGTTVSAAPAFAAMSYHGAKNVSHVAPLKVEEVDNTPINWEKFASTTNSPISFWHFPTPQSLEKKYSQQHLDNIVEAAGKFAKA